MPCATDLAGHWGQMHRPGWILDIRPHNQYPHRPHVDCHALDCPLTSSSGDKAKSNHHQLLRRSNLVSLRQARLTQLRVLLHCLYVSQHRGSHRSTDLLPPERIREHQSQQRPYFCLLEADAHERSCHNLISRHRLHTIPQTFPRGPRNRHVSRRWRSGHSRPRLRLPICWEQVRHFVEDPRKAQSLPAGRLANGNPPICR